MRAGYKLGQLYLMMALVLLAVGLMGCSGQPSQQQTPAASPAGSTTVTTAEPAKTASPAKQALTKVVVQVPTKSLNVMPFYFGVEKGIYKEVGLDIQMVEMKPELAITAIAAGSSEVDYSASSGSVARAALTGMPVKVFTFFVNDLTWTFMAAKNVKEAKDLRGKVVGVTSLAGSNALAAREAISHFGLDAGKDVTYVALGKVSDMLAALETGSIHAGMFSPPYDYTARTQGFVPLIRASEVISFPVSGFGASEQKLANNPEQVKNMIKATIRSVQYVVDHPDEAIAFIMKEWQVDRDNAKGSYESTIPSLSRDGSASEKSLITELEINKSEAKITREVSLADSYDFRLLAEVQRELGLK